MTSLAPLPGVRGDAHDLPAHPHLDIGMTGNGAIAGLVAITAPSGYVEFWAKAPPIGLVAGMIVVAGVILIDKVVDDPVGALSSHGLAGIWGTLACGLFTSPRLAELNAIGKGGLFYTGSFEQLGVQALGVAAMYGGVHRELLVFCDQGHLRPAGAAGGGALRPRHRRARHVGLPRAVHAGAGLRVPPARRSAQRLAPEARAHRTPARGPRKGS